MTLAEALANSAAPPEILATQVLLDVPFTNFDGPTPNRTKSSSRAT